MKAATLGTHLEAVALADLGQHFLQVEPQVVAPGLGTLDEEYGQVTAHLCGWLVQLLLFLLLLSHR